MQSQALLDLPLFDRPQRGVKRLRDYQRRIVITGGVGASGERFPGVLNGLNKFRTGLVVAPTGTGKGCMIAETAKQLLPEGPGLVLAESRAILRQLQGTLTNWCGVDVGLEQAKHYQRGEDIVCASRQTLGTNELRLEKLVKRGIRWILIDEAHHAGKRDGQYREITDHFPEAYIVGFTATPDRADRKAMGAAFDGKFYVYEIHEARDEGWLVGVKTPKLDNWAALDLSRVRKVAGELHEGEVEKLMAEVVKDQAAAGVEKVGDHKSIWFTNRVEVAHQLAKAIDAEMGRSGAARAVDGGMIDDEKDELLDGFKLGEFQHLVNVGIATEGFDCPDAVAAVLTRPSLSRGRFTQQSGRVLRPCAPGLDDAPDAAARKALIAGSKKPWAMLVNYRYLKGRHTLVCPDDVLGGKYDDEVRAAAQGIRDDDDTLTVDESLKLAQQKVDESRAAREAELRRKAELAAAAQRQAQAQWSTFDAFEGVPYFDEDGQPFWTPGRSEPPAEPITEKQRKYLRWGLKVPESEIPTTKKAASRLIGQLKARTGART